MDPIDQRLQIAILRAITDLRREILAELESTNELLTTQPNMKNLIEKVVDEYDDQLVEITHFENYVILKTEEYFRKKS